MTAQRWEPSPWEPGQVVGLPWPDYLNWSGGKLLESDGIDLPEPLAPGQHAALIGTTGDGKTTHAVGILAQRKYVLALDPKGEDETLEQSGFIRVRSLPVDGVEGMWKTLRGKGDQRAWRDIEERIAEGLDARVIIGGGARTDKEDFALQQLMRDAVTFCRHGEGWTLYVDEFELLSSQRMYKLGPLIERMLITARRAKTSVITSFQAPAWVSKHALPGRPAW